MDEYDTPSKLAKYRTAGKHVPKVSPSAAGVRARRGSGGGMTLLREGSLLTDIGRSGKDEIETRDIIHEESWSVVSSASKDGSKGTAESTPDVFFADVEPEEEDTPPPTEPSQKSRKPNLRLDLGQLKKEGLASDEFSLFVEKKPPLEQQQQPKETPQQGTSSGTGSHVASVSVDELFGSTRKHLLFEDKHDGSVSSGLRSKILDGKEATRDDEFEDPEEAMQEFASFLPENEGLIPYEQKKKEKEKEKEKGHAKDKDKDKDKSPLKLVKPFSLQIPMLAESGVKASVGSDGEPLPTMTTPPPVGGTGTETAVPEGMVDSAKVSTLSSHASSEIPPKFNMVDATKEWMRQHNLQRETEKEKKDKDKDIDEKKGDTVRTGVTDVADDMQLEEHPPVDVQQKPTEGEENEQEAQEVRTEPVSEKSEQGKMPLLFEVPLVMEDLKAVVSHTMQKATILPTEMEHDRTEMKDDGMDVEPTTHHVSDLGESGSQLVEKSEDVLKTHEKSSEMGVMPSTAMEVEKTEQFSFPEREEEAKVSLPDETAPEEAVETAWTDGMNTEIHTSDQPNVEDVEKPAPPPDELKESEIMEAVEGVDENRVEEHQPSSSTMDVEGPLPPCLGEEKTTGAMSTIPHDELSTEKSPGEARREESVSEEVEMQEQAVEGNEVVEGQGEDKATHDPSDATISESEVLLDKDAASRDDAEFLIEEELSMKENSEGSRLDAVAGEKRESTMDSDTITEDVVPGESRSPLPQADSIPINHRSSTLDGDPSASVDEEKHIETVDQLENTEESLNEKTQTTEEFPRDDQPSKTSSSSREQETTVVRDEPSGDLEKEV
eukprot:TRINITY_DN598_c1_g4_i6.p1 TRINITY_DN598_c1_g4~~TRINITY_DN598_c1_g4_i6.p1  ORF type:complete len:833 (-),score=312.43 TRINITY_DN598_c1_g4_i6:49-2547(-)